MLGPEQVADLLEEKHVVGAALGGGLGPGPTALGQLVQGTHDQEEDDGGDGQEPEDGVEQGAVLEHPPLSVGP